jgi:hypothetical protein
MKIGENPVDTNPLLPLWVQFAVLSTFVLGLVCTVMAVRYALRGEMRPSAVLTIFLLNFLLVIGPVAAALGMMARHRQRRLGSHLTA